MGLRTAVPFLTGRGHYDNPHTHSSELAFANLQKQLVWICSNSLETDFRVVNRLSKVRCSARGLFRNMLLML